MKGNDFFSPKYFDKKILSKLSSKIQKIKNSSSGTLEAVQVIFDIFGVSLLSQTDSFQHLLSVKKFRIIIFLLNTYSIISLFRFSLSNFPFFPYPPQENEIRLSLDLLLLFLISYLF